MYKFTIDAFDMTDLGAVNRISITVQAANKEAALARAAEIEPRSNYSVTGVEDLSPAGTDNRRELKKKD